MNMPSVFNSIPTRLLTAAMALALGGSLTLQAQTINANGQVSGLLSSPGVYHYSLTIGEGLGTTTPIGSIWYAWVPGVFYLPSVPTSASAPAGWTATVFANSIQFSANSAADDIAPGTSKTFDYFATFSPTQLAAAPNSGVSVAYAGAVDASSPSEIFSVQTVPEPSIAALGLVGLFLDRKRFRV
jgi:hypothetical protein